MAKDGKRDAGNPFEALKGMKERLPRTRAEREAQREAERQSRVSEDAASRAPPSEPGSEEDFDRTMEGWGVERIESGPERVERRRQAGEPAGAGREPARRRRARRGVRGPDDGFDESTPRLDLHGLSVEHALAELHRHLQSWRAAGVVRARIVTGRGAHSGDGRAAIREAVEERLLASGGVVGVYRGSPAAGGDGVVLLELQGPGKRGRRRS